MITNNETRLKSIIAKQLYISADDVQLDQSFSADLGCDELDDLEIAFSIEDELSVDISLHDWDNVSTVGDALELIESCHA